MNFDLSKLGSFKLEDLVQQGLDTILQRQSKSPPKGNEQVDIVKISLDRKGKLYKLPPSHRFTIAAYQIKYENAVGSILITLDNLRDFNKMLNQEILEAAGKGNLRAADKYIRQKRNVDVSNYTHRVKAYRVTESKAKILTWIIDWDLHKETSDENSYGSGTARAVVQDLAVQFIDHPRAKESRKDYLDSIMDMDWVGEIRQVALPFYNHTQLSHKTIYHHRLEGNISPGR